MEVPLATDNSVSIGELFSKPMFRVVVGAEKKTYRIHDCIATKHSDYFRLALEPSRFVEGDERVVHLSDIEPAVFEIFLHWLYTQQLPNLPGGSLMKWTRLYVLADRFLVLNLRELIIIKLVNLCNAGLCEPSYTVITFAFENLPTQCPFRQLLVDITYKCWRGPIAGIATDSFRSLPDDFLAMIIWKYASSLKESRIATTLVASNYEKVDAKQDSETSPFEEEPREKKQKV